MLRSMFYFKSYQFLYAVYLQENEGSTSLKIVNELTVQTFIQCLTSTIKILLENLDWMTNRLRSEYGVLTYAGDESLERSNMLIVTIKQKFLTVFHIFRERTINK